MRLALPGILRRLWSARAAEAVVAPPSELPAETLAVTERLLAVPAPATAECGWLRAVLEAADDGLVAVDASGRLRLLNPAAAGLLDVEPRCSSADADWPEGASVLQPVLQQALQEGQAQVELQLERGGRQLLLAGRANPTYSESGLVDGAVLVLQDTTLHGAQMADRSEDWATLAHDLKTPLNAISGFTTLLLQEAVGPLNPLQRDFLRTIEQEGQRLIDAVQGCLDEARAGGPQSRLNPVELRLQSVVGDLVDRLRPLAVRKGLGIEVELSPMLPAVEADRDKLELLLLNLLDNALSFGPPGTRVRVTARELGDRLEVAVEDEGAGIPAECLSLIFGRYYRAPNQPSGGRAGVGLGLAICKQIVEQHGGRIWAENRAGGGTRLAFTLPVVYHQARLEALGVSW
jgi:signal transduction histidine kinase